jgi:hypothetical protein
MWPKGQSYRHSFGRLWHPAVLSYLSNLWLVFSKSLAQIQSIQTDICFIALENWRYSVPNPAGRDRTAWDLGVILCAWR